jgi:hypothetical protein
MRRKLWAGLVMILMFVVILSACHGGRAAGPSSSSNTYGDLLAGSFNNLTNYPTPTDITYKTIDGITITESAYPGQVMIIANANATSSIITQLITSNGGTVVAQIPNAGLYCATIDPNTLNTFLSAMYQSSYIGDAFPNGVNDANVGSATVKSIPRNYSASSTTSSLFTTGLPVDSSLIQTIDSPKLTGCGTLTHEAAVAAVAGQCVSANINDITSASGYDPNVGISDLAMFGAITDLLHNAQTTSSSLPLIINISMGKQGADAGNIKVFNRFAMALLVVSQHYPNILKNALILFGGGNVSKDISNAFSMKNGVTKSIYFDSGVMDHLYVVASQKGTTDTDTIYGCPVTYASVGSPNVFSASNCNRKIPDQYCIFHGTSFGTPAIANLIARTFLASNKTIPLSTIAKALWNYQTNNNGTLPTALQLLSSSGWTGPVPTSCNLTCGTHQTTNNCVCFTSTTLNQTASGINALNVAYGIRDYSDISAGYIVGVGTSPANDEVSFYGYMDANASFNVVPINSSILLQSGVQGILVQGINFSGATVGSYEDSAFNTHGFILPNGGGSSTDGKSYDFPGTTGGTIIRSINNSGIIAGYYSDSKFLTHGFYDGKSYDFPGTTGGTIISSINNAGTIAGYYSDSGGASHGFTLQSGSTVPVSYDFPGTTGGTIISSINDSGIIAGYYEDSTGVSHGFYDGVSYDFPGTTGGTIIKGINNKDTFAGSYEIVTNNTVVTNAFITSVAR